MSDSADRDTFHFDRDDRSRLRSRDRDAELPDRELERQRAAERKAADAHAAEAERAYRDRLAKLEKRERWAALADFARALGDAHFASQTCPSSGRLPQDC